MIAVVQKCTLMSGVRVMEKSSRSIGFLAPAVKKQKAPRKHPPKLMYCAVYHTGKVV